MHCSVVEEIRWHQKHKVLILSFLQIHIFERACFPFGPFISDFLLGKLHLEALKQFKLTYQKKSIRRKYSSDSSWGRSSTNSYVSYNCWELLSWENIHCPIWRCDDHLSNHCKCDNQPVHICKFSSYSRTDIIIHALTCLFHHVWLIIFSFHTSLDVGTYF